MNFKKYILGILAILFLSVHSFAEKQVFLGEGKVLVRGTADFVEHVNNGFEIDISTNCVRALSKCGLSQVGTILSANDIIISENRENATTSEIEWYNQWDRFNFVAGSITGIGAMNVAARSARLTNVLLHEGTFTNHLMSFSLEGNGVWNKVRRLFSGVEVQGAGNWATTIGKNIDELVEAPLGYQIFTKNGSKYIRRIDATDINTPRLMVDETGSIVKYAKPQRLANSTKLRANLEKVLGKAPDNHQAHHLVPSNVVEKSALHKEAMNRGLYDVDRAGNGKFLAETDEDFVALSEAFPTHFGSHPNYDIQITKQIDDVLRANNLTTSSNLSNLTNQQLTNMIDDIEDLSLNVLENWKPSKLN